MRSELTKQNTEKNIIGAIMIGSFTGIVICTTILMLCGFLFTKSQTIPHGVLEPAALVSAGIGSFAGGYVCGRIMRKKGVIWGLACGMTMFVIFLIGGLICSHGSITAQTPIKFLVLISTGATGGITAVNKR